MHLKSFLAAMLVSSVSSIALAQTYSNVISFGDSLTDNGNLYGLTGNPTSPPYFNGRFSNGPTFAEILAGNIRPQAGPNGTMYNFGQAALGGNVNYAFGGARADNNPNLNGPIPSVQTQIGAYSVHGGTIGANSLVTLWAGANDIFQTPGVYNQTTINNSALQMRNSILMLGGLGARTIIIMNLPDLGATPAYAGGPGAGLATTATNAYNTAQDTQITAARAAAPNVNIIRVNANAISTQILANPAAFGFSNVTSQCIMTAACIGGSAATQAGYFFWDSVHPTTAAHALFANIIQQYAQYGKVASTTHSLAEVGLTLRQSNIGRSLDLMANARYGAWPSQKGEMTLSATFDYLKNAGGGNRTPFSGHAEGAQLTYARASGADMAYGGQISAQFGQVTQALLKYSPLSLSMDGWLTRKYGATFVNLAAGASYNSYGSYNRGSGVGNLNMVASPTGSSLGAALQVGHSVKMTGFTLTPSASLNVLNAKVDSYNETGLVAPLAVSARSLTAMMGSVEMRADMPLNATLSGHALIGYQALLAVSGNSVTAGLSDNPVTPFTTALSQIAGNGVYFGAGISGKITGAAVMSLDYRGGYTNGANHKLTGAVKLAF